MVIPPFPMLARWVHAGGHVAAACAHHVAVPGVAVAGVPWRARYPATDLRCPSIRAQHLADGQRRGVVAELLREGVVGDRGADGSDLLSGNGREPHRLGDDVLLLRLARTV